MTAALLASYGVANMVVNRYCWLSNTPRAHITNQRTMEVLRDLGPEVEAEAMMHASPQELMGENIFASSSRRRRSSPRMSVISEPAYAVGMTTWSAPVRTAIALPSPVVDPLPSATTQSARRS